MRRRAIATCKTPNTGRDRRSRRDRDVPGPRACARPSPPSSSGVVKKGRALFETAGCANCHGGSQLDQQRDRFRTAARAPHQIVDAQLITFLCRVGTFDPTLFTDGVSNEIKANNAAGNAQARGIDGFNPPSLIAVFNSAPYLHSGARTDAGRRCSTTRRIERSAGTDGLDTLTDARDRKALAKFLQSIDRTTVPVRPRAVRPPASAAHSRTTRAADTGDEAVEGRTSNGHENVSEISACAMVAALVTMVGG